MPARRKPGHLPPRLPRVLPAVAALSPEQPAPKRASRSRRSDTRGRLARDQGRLAWIASEAAEQRALIRWAHLARIPPAADVQSGAKVGDYLFAIANGELREPRTATLLRLAGVKAGVSDLFLPIARGGFHGLWIELKARDGMLGRLQLDWHNRVTHSGYLSVVSRGWIEAKGQIEGYLTKCDIGIEPG